LTAIKPSLATTPIGFSNGNGVADIGTPSKEKLKPRHLEELQISIGGYDLPAQEGRDTRWLGSTSTQLDEN
jgi:hypothetical protein